MKKTSIAILCLALICRLGAEEPTAPAAPSTPVAPAPAQLELAREVIKAMQLDRMFDQMVPQMQKIVAQQLDASSPNQTPAQKEAATKAMNEAMAISMDATKDMLSKVDTIYAEVYSEAELKAMLAFFASSEGKSMLQKQPEVMQHMTPLIMEMQKEMGPKIQALVQKAKADAEAEAAATAPTAPTAPAATTNAKVSP